MKYLKMPNMMQFAGAVVFGVTVWKGVHGFVPTAGLIAGAGMAYVGKHFSGLVR